MISSIHVGSVTCYRFRRIAHQKDRKRTYIIERDKAMLGS